jgi:hypothetical protein
VEILHPFPGSSDPEYYHLRYGRWSYSDSAAASCSGSAGPFEFSESSVSNSIAGFDSANCCNSVTTASTGMAGCPNCSQSSA